MRGLPANAWVEKNLMDITGELGSWGWWINRADEGNFLENPKVCHYTDDLNPIFLKSWVKVKNVGYEIRIVEVFYNFS